VHVANCGSATLLVNGRECTEADLAQGDVIDVADHYVFLFRKRPASLDRLRHARDPAHPFGEADAHGILGESPAAWALRDAIAFAAHATPHVLVGGPSGTGKELAARAIHTLSRRAKEPFVARNAATLPPGLIDAELFGHVKNYPNPGMPERPGLVGEADGGTLFLDEIGELPEALQARLLRLLDGGEYHRLGESKARRADIRLVGATNRAPSALKHDLLARLTLAIELPSLADRCEDVPLLARHLVLAAARRDPTVAARFVQDNGKARAEIRIEPASVTALLRRDYPTNVRELEKVLWRAMAATLEDTLRIAHEPSPREGPEDPGVDELLSGLNEKAPSKENVRATLARCEGKVQLAADALGISRHAMKRLIAKHRLRGA
jgi:two-component system nitrogen regulation response regulator GlnG/two-component system response regulator HydG